MALLSRIQALQAFLPSGFSLQKKVFRFVDRAIGNPIFGCVGP
jgi:hypothetical protein